MSATHEVVNQVPPLVSFDAADYAPILEALQREGAHDALEELHDVGRLAGSEEAQRWGDPPRRTLPSCAPTTATATASTRWSTTPRTTN